MKEYVISMFFLCDLSFELYCLWHNDHVIRPTRLVFVFLLSFVVVITVLKINVCCWSICVLLFSIFLHYKMVHQPLVQLATKICERLKDELQKSR